MTLIPVPKVHSGIRVISMLLDHFFMCLLSFVFAIPLVVKLFMLNLSKANDSDVGSVFSGPLMYIAIAGFSCYFCKDSFNGRSFPKRIFGLQVINRKTGNAASPLQCFTRNLFCVLWPIEVIITLINPEQRLGDIVAGTRTIAVDRSALPKQNINVPQVVVSYLLSLSLSITIFLLLQKR